MTEIDPYIRLLCFREVAELPMPAGHCRGDEYLPHLSKIIQAVLSKYEVPDTITNVDDLARELFDELVKAKVLNEDIHKFAGTYYQYSKQRYAQFRLKALEGDPIHVAANRVGARFFPDTFKGYLGQRNLDDIEAATRGNVALPASDRIVFLGDNVRGMVEEIEEIKGSIRSHNDEAGKLDGRRDRIVSELSAGQELLKAPSVRTRAVVTVLLGTLSFIATEFAESIIGELAINLLKQLQSLLGL